MPIDKVNIKPLRDEHFSTRDRRRCNFGNNYREKIIDWSRLGRAVDFYVGIGFTYVEVPWSVDEKFVGITHPAATSFKAGDKALVGSAEQSFLSLTAQDIISDGRRYVACTPCFRDSQPDDRFHQATFMKVELYWPLAEAGWDSVGRLRHAAATFFASEGAFPVFLETDQGWDINVSGIEVGSYGSRQTADHSWAYGTGLAEPRFSQALRGQEDWVVKGRNHMLQGSSE